MRRAGQTVRHVNRGTTKRNRGTLKRASQTVRHRHRGTIKRNRRTLKRASGMLSASKGQPEYRSGDLLETCTDSQTFKTRKQRNNKQKNI